MAVTERRIEAVVERCDDAELDALLVTDLTNVRYLSGFTGTNGLVVVGGVLRLFISDFRYTQQARQQVKGLERIQAERDLFRELRKQLGQRRLRLGFDDQNLTVKQHAQLRELLPEAIELVPAGGIVQAVRAVKSRGELERIAAAAELADSALEAVLKRGVVGRRECDVALELEVEMRELGADGISFPPIVAAAERGALPHAEPSEHKIPRNTLLVLDYGAKLDGYCSDCTRTVATGEIEAEARSVYELVLRAQTTALAAVQPGVRGREVDAVAREIIDAAGFGDKFGHGLGHGVGLEVHEGPTLSARGEQELQRGNVVTVEPGIYIARNFGVRIEDLVVVGADGPRVLSTLSKTLRIVS